MEGRLRKKKSSIDDERGDKENRRGKRKGLIKEIRKKIGEKKEKERSNKGKGRNINWMKGMLGYMKIIVK